MDMSFDFGAVLREKKRTTVNRQTIGRPSQFASVAGGILKRFETNLRNRRSSRLSAFDSKRDLPKSVTPAKTVTQSKIEHRRQQLEKWKAEKEQKKKVAALQKKEPFRTGIVPTSLTFVPPPPPPKPSSSRVTWSQARNTTNAKPTTTMSFAPKNAGFKPPHIKNMVKLPTLAPPKLRIKTVIFNFDPVLRNLPSKPTTRQTQTHVTQLSSTRGKSQIETPSVRRNNQPRSKPMRPAHTETIQTSSTRGKSQIETRSFRGNNQPRSKPTRPADTATIQTSSTHGKFKIETYSVRGNNQPRSKPSRPADTETIQTSSTHGKSRIQTRSVRGSMVKIASNSTSSFTESVQSSFSSGEIEPTSKPIKRVQTPGHRQVKTASKSSSRLTESIQSSSSGNIESTSKPIKRVQTPGHCKPVLNEAKKVITFNSSENSSDTDQSPRPETQSIRKCSVISIASSSGKQSCDSSLEEKQSPVKNRIVRKSYRRQARSSGSIQQSVPRTSCNTLKGQAINRSSSEEKEPLGNSNGVEQSEIGRSPRVSVISIRSSSGKTSIDCNPSIEKSSPVLTYTPNCNKNVHNINLSVIPQSLVPRSESGSEQKLRSPQLVEHFSLTPEQIEIINNSPFITVARGSENSVKEKKRKLKIMMENDGPSEYESRAECVAHFRRLLASEIDRMTGLCNTWEQLSQQTALADCVKEEMLSVVGLARLLMASKMQQFASLVEQCARGESAARPVVPADLHGFWDMVYLQVENIDIRFIELEKLRARNGREEATVAVPKKVVNRAAKPAAKTAAKPAVKTASSSLKDMIAAARKAKKEKLPAVSLTLIKTPSGVFEASGPAEKTQDLEAAGTLEASTATPEKTFEAGFFTVRSPVRVPSARSTPRGDTLLKTVLSSEAQKSASRSSSFAMLRASILAKNLEYDGIALLPVTPEVTPVDLNATPSRSILKSTNARSENNSAVKSAKVHFKFRRTLDDSYSNLVTEDPVEDNVSVIEGVKKLALETQTSPEKSQSVAVDKSSSVKTIHERQVVTRRMQRLLHASEIADNERKENVFNTNTPNRRQSRRKAVEQKNSKVNQVASVERGSTFNRALKQFDTNVVDKDVLTKRRSSKVRKSVI